MHYAFKTVGQMCEMNLVILGHMAPDLSEEQKVELKEHFEIEAEKAVVKTDRVVSGDLEGRMEELVGLDMVALVGVARK